MSARINETVDGGMEGLCILLKMFAYPCRLSDLVPRFERSVPELSEIVSEVANHTNTHAYTARPIARPGEQQRVMYNGHKKVHTIKFQSVVAPNGLIANPYGPVGLSNFYGYF